MKKCMRCKVLLERKDFYKDITTKSKLCSYCKNCDKAKRKKNYLINPHSAETRKKNTKTYRERNPIKYKCRNKTTYAISSGKLRKMPCEVCGEKKVDGHHDDYTKPLVMRWLCRKHHKEFHMLLRSNHFPNLVK